ncbi:MAG: polymer-forming cytoskeletal protein, partial [Patescibacteria group bacterium]
MRLSATLAVSLSLLLVPMVGLAAVFVTDEETAQLTESVSDDVYAASQTVRISGNVTGDVAAAGEKVEITGNVTQDVHAAGETVSLEGEVGDDVHAAGANVALLGKVAGDAFLAGSEVMVGEEASVGGDVYAGSSNLVISGNVQGDVWAAGQVHVTAGAVINGGLLVMSNEAPVIDEGAQIAGEVKLEALTHDDRERPFQLMGWVRSVVSLFIVSLVLVYGARALTTSTVRTVVTKSWRSLLVGGLWTLLFVPVSLILLVTIAGIPLALGV